MCHSRHNRRAVSRPTATAQAPRRDPELRASDADREAPRRDPELRASDADRESTVALLREHGAAGRLAVEELEERVGAAYAARTHGELSELLDDLPARRAARTAVRKPQREEWSGFLAVNALLVVIWAVSGAGYFWPAWVMVWWALALVMKSAPRVLRLR